jgi:hypothetical protein
MKTILTFLLFVSLAVAQELPNAPSTQMDTQVHNVPNYALAPSTPRGKNKLFILAAVVGFEIAADAYDIHETEKGIKAGVAFEGNTFLIPDNGRPTASQLWRRDTFELGMAVTPSILGYVFRKSGLFYGGLAIPAVLGGKHISGGKQWADLLNKAGK